MFKLWRMGMLAIIAAAAVSMAACNNNADNNTGNNTGGQAGDQQGAAPQNGADQGNAVAANAEAIARQNCITCHGDQLDGRGAENMNLQTVGSRLSAEEIANVITNGRGGMPAFKGNLTDDEIAALSEWLSTHK